VNAKPTAGVLAAALLSALLPGCAALAPIDELTWSAPLAKSLPRQDGEAVEVARFSRQRPGGFLGEWEPFLVLSGNIPTEYRLVESDGVVVLEADALEGGSAVWRKIRIDLRRHPVMEWRWRVPRDSGAGGAGGPSSASPPVRISLGFDGDAARLDFEDRAKLRLAKVLTVNGLPYASLLYVWLNRLPAEAVYPSPHTERVRHVVVESGEGRLDQWVSVRRNVLEDYRRAIGEEPGDIVGIGLMTDPGDNNGPRRAWYGDITFRSR